MLLALLTRPKTVKLVMAFFVAAQMLGWIGYAQIESSAVTAPPIPNPPPASKSPPEVRLALREFDRFLDHHPWIEDRLRLAPALASDPAFLHKTPNLRVFLSTHPNVVVGLNIYPRYFLNRALLRQASAPVAFSILALFKDVFQAHPEVEQALTENPALIRDPAFLQAHAPLLELLKQHPELGRVFLPTSLLAQQID